MEGQEKASKVLCRVSENQGISQAKEKCSRGNSSSAPSLPGGSWPPLTGTEMLNWPVGHRERHCPSPSVTHVSQPNRKSSAHNWTCPLSSTHSACVQRLCQWMMYYDFVDFFKSHWYMKHVWLDVPQKTNWSWILCAISKWDSQDKWDLWLNCELTPNWNGQTWWMFNNIHSKLQQYLMELFGYKVSFKSETLEWRLER